MLLKDLITKNKITENLFKELNQEILLHEVKGISSNSKEIKKDFIFVKEFNSGAFKGNSNKTNYKIHHPKGKKSNYKYILWKPKSR